MYVVYLRRIWEIRIYWVYLTNTWFWVATVDRQQWWRTSSWFRTVISHVKTNSIRSSSTISGWSQTAACLHAVLASHRTWRRSRVLQEPPTARVRYSTRLCALAGTNEFSTCSTRLDNLMLFPMSLSSGRISWMASLCKRRGKSMPFLVVVVLLLMALSIIAYRLL